MAHLIVVGRSDSGAQEAYQQLVNQGLHPAKPSTIHELPPQGINAKLLASLPPLLMGAGVSQATLGNAWNSLALDLLVANAEPGQPWGWYDQAALPLLNFWGEADSNARFLLAYSHPAKALEVAQDISALALGELITEWCAYNTELQHFFHRNKHRCLLVNTDSFASDWQKPARLLSEHLGLELAKEAMHPTNAESASSFHREICGLVAQEFDDALAVFDELEAAASLPAPAQQESRASALLGAYRDYVKQQAEYEKNRNEFALLRQAYNEQNNRKIEDKLLLAQLHSTQEELKKYYTEYEKARKEVQQHAKRITELSKPHGAVERVHNHLSYRIGKTLLVCSSSVIGWLCMPAALIYQALDFRATQRRLGKTSSLPLNEYADIKQARQIQSYQSYRLGTAIVSNARSLSGWMRMPSAIRQALKAKKLKK